AMAAAGWLETTTPFVPWMRGRKLVKVVPGTGTMTSLVGLMPGAGERRLASCPSGPLASSDTPARGEVGLDLVLPHAVHCWRSTIVLNWHAGELLGSLRAGGAPRGGIAAQKPAG